MVKHIFNEKDIYLVDQRASYIKQSKNQHDFRKYSALKNFSFQKMSITKTKLNSHSSMKKKDFDNS